jgi:hypothetical protein
MQVSFDVRSRPHVFVFRVDIPNCIGVRKYIKQLKLFFHAFWLTANVAVSVPVYATTGALVLF